MASWTVVPCLLTLRDEFNAVAPGRDKGADGTIGDSSHTSSSDHTPDEDSDVLRDHDPDSKNEVHALDIDSTGPWPWSFDAKIKELAQREKADYEHPTIIGRLKYIIWNRKIISRSWGWNGWRDYTGSSTHTDHAHFSARYDTQAESSTRPWGVTQEDDMQLTDTFTLSNDACQALGKPNGSVVTVETAYELILIHAARESREHFGELSQRLGELDATVEAQAQIIAEQKAQLDRIEQAITGHVSGLIEGAGGVS